MEASTPTCWVHPCKCLACSLHWNVYSWREEWPNDGDVTRKPVFCPECGANTILRFKGYEQDGFIFHFVPGMRSQGISEIHGSLLEEG